MAIAKYVLNFNDNKTLKLKIFDHEICLKEQGKIQEGDRYSSNIGGLKRLETFFETCKTISKQKYSLGSSIPSDYWNMSYDDFFKDRKTIFIFREIKKKNIG